MAKYTHIDGPYIYVNNNSGIPLIITENEAGVYKNGFFIGVVLKKCVKEIILLLENNKL